MSVFKWFMCCTNLFCEPGGWRSCDMSCFSRSRAFVGKGHRTLAALYTWLVAPRGVVSLSRHLFETCT